MATDDKFEFAFACTNMMGHLMPVVPFMKELLECGHHVTCFVSNDPKYRQKLKDLGLGSAEVVDVQLPTEVNLHTASKIQVLLGGGPLAFMSQPLFGAMCGHYRGRDTRPAVIVADFFAPAALDAADALGVPGAVVYPNPLGLLYLVSPWQRGWVDHVRVAFARLLEGVIARLILAFRNRQRRLVGLPAMLEQDMWPCDTMRRPFINTWGLGFEYAFLQSPLSFYVGPTELSVFEPLSGGLAEWFEHETRSIVYVAFGTMHEFTSATSNSLLQQLGSISEVAVLWSLPHSQQTMLKELPANVRLESFVPQIAVLRHPKVVAFVTHCGSNSVGESVLSGTPLVCVPGGKDQPANAARVASSRIGVVAKGGELGVGRALREVLQDRAGFKERALKLRRVMLSQGGARRGAEILTGIAEVGYQHLMPNGQRTSWSRCLLGVVVAAYVFFRGLPGFGRVGIKLVRFGEL